MIKDRSLYLVLSSEYAPARDVLALTEQALISGVDILQLREKNLVGEQLFGFGQQVAKLCQKYHKTFIVNDDPTLAQRLNADGVHLGQEDLKQYPLARVRQIIPQGIIGVSTHDLKQFKQANCDGVDYIAYGPIFATQTKDYFIGLAQVEKVLALAKKPVFLIGGINLENLETLLDLGARNIALIRAILAARDVSAVTRTIKEKLIKTKNESLY